MYEYRDSPSPLVSIVWRSVAEESGTYVDAANEFWGLAFGTGHRSAFEAVLIGPSLTTRELDVHAGYSERQLQRRFSAEVGLGRKQVAQMQRARRAYALLQAGRSLADAAAEVGYADQAHMTRSFRLIAGRTPASILADAADEFTSRPARG